MGIVQTKNVDGRPFFVDQSRLAIVLLFMMRLDTAVALTYADGYCRPYERLFSEKGCFREDREGSGRASGCRCPATRDHRGHHPGRRADYRGGVGRADEPLSRYDPKRSERFGRGRADHPQTLCWLVGDQALWSGHPRALHHAFSPRAAGGRLVAEQIDASKAIAINDALDYLREEAQGGEWVRIADADFGFHKQIVDLSGNARLMAQYGMLDAQIRMYIRAFSGMFTNLDEIMAPHEAIAAAIISGDKLRAGQLSEDHNLVDGNVLERHIAKLATA